MRGVLGIHTLGILRIRPRTTLGPSSTPGKCAGLQKSPVQQAMDHLLQQLQKPTCSSIRTDHPTFQKFDPPRVRPRLRLLCTTRRRGQYRLLDQVRPSLQLCRKRSKPQEAIESTPMRSMEQQFFESMQTPKMESPKPPERESLRPGLPQKQACKQHPRGARRKSMFGCCSSSAVTIALKRSRSTASASPAGTDVASAHRTISESSRRISSLRTPLALER